MLTTVTAHNIEVKTPRCRSTSPVSPNFPSPCRGFQPIHYAIQKFDNGSKHLIASAQLLSLTHLKAGFALGAKAAAEAKKAMEKTTFMVRTRAICERSNAMHSHQRHSSHAWSSMSLSSNIVGRRTRT